MTDTVAPIASPSPSEREANTDQPKSRQQEPPPTEKIAVLRWMKENLFASPANTVLTVILVAALVYWVPPFIQWAIIDAIWYTPDPEVCRQSDGACWAVVGEKHRPMLFGLYPYEEHWRLVVALAVYLGSFTITLIRRFWHWKILVPLWAFAVTTISIMLWGGVFGLTFVETSQWGGLPLTMVLFSGTVVLGFPIAILLALGAALAPAADQGGQRDDHRVAAWGSAHHDPVRGGERVPACPAGRA